jgi:hypothetical protein
MSVAREEILICNPNIRAKDLDEAIAIENRILITWNAAGCVQFKVD